jgi:hypothetical protein
MNLWLKHLGDCYSEQKEAMLELDSLPLEGDLLETAPGL